MPRDLLLALDLATRTGWAVLRLDGSRVDSGTFTCAPTKSNPCRWSRWLDQLRGLGLTDRFAAVAVEKPITYGAAGRAADAARVAFGLMATLELWVHRLRPLEIVEFAPATVKFHATGSGRANKGQVAEAMIRRFKHVAVDDNEADALAVGVTALELLDRDALACGEIKRVERPAKKRAKKAKAA